MYTKFMRPYNIDYKGKGLFVKTHKISPLDLLKMLKQQIPSCGFLVAPDGGDRSPPNSVAFGRQEEREDFVHAMAASSMGK